MGGGKHSGNTTRRTQRTQSQPTRGRVSPEEALVISNPNYAASVANGDRRYTENCNRCWIAYEENRRGNTCEAKPTYRGDQYGAFYSNGSYREAYVGQEWAQVAKRAGGGRTAAQNSWREMQRVMLQHGEGARFGIRIRWLFGGGHVFNGEVIGGEVRLFDAQTHHEVNPMDYLSRASLGTPGNLQVSRVDNLPLRAIHREKALVMR